ncbi:hypothetical protein AJ80_02102 [Polytolypa hystricis UAMH7299]|uniref:Efflux pump dotC n=1 Tax=Polytolypa hystricis (strain UAMH7299) TaxID=1447883 RepID=A0A2B7YIE1_POLH7|nr:hypothetical protein AJ80_02102 [Polytolypa hystricis UAMH7299]
MAHSVTTTQGSPAPDTKSSASTVGQSDSTITGNSSALDSKLSEHEDSIKQSNVAGNENSGDQISAATGTPPPSNEGDNVLEKVVSQAGKMKRKQIFLIVGALCLALFLAALDMTIISTALPTIARQFNANESGFSWMASSYLLANAACMPLWGKISDIWGRKPIILIANALFLVASLICALAKNLAMFLVGRALQGIGGGGLIILGQICISDLFSMRERPIYYAMFGATWAIAGSLGPIIGGALTQEVTWRWCFYLNLPVGSVSFLILLFLLKIETPKTPLFAGLRTIDWVGTLTIIGGTLMFLFGLEFGGVTFPWNSPTVICLIVFGVVVLALFGVYERRFAKYPIMPMSVFETWSNICILITNWAHGSVFIAGSYFLPLYFQTVLGAGPILSGVYVMPQVVSLSVLSLFGGVIIRKTGRYIEIIRAGTIIMTLGYGLYIDLQAYASWPRIIIYQIITGIGIGPNFQAPLIALQSSIRPSEVAAAISTFGFIRQLSTSTSVVLGTVVYQNVMRQSTQKLVDAVGPELAPRFGEAFAGADTQLMDSLTEAQRLAVREVFTHALSRGWIFYLCIAAVGCFFSMFIRKIELSKEHEVVKTGLEQQERGRQERLAAQKEKKRNKEKEKEDASKNKETV